jgi:hypothetical protein
MMLDKIDGIILLICGMIHVYKRFEKQYFLDISGQELHQAKNDRRFTTTGFGSRHIQFIRH